MTIYPAPLRPGDTIAVTAPSSPVSSIRAARLDFVIGWLRERGYTVIEGECLRGEGYVSASAQARADEFNACVRDPHVGAILPPWGGETAIDLVDLLDYGALREHPTWVMGWSDISTLLLPLTLRSGVATIHGQNLMDLPYELPDGTAHLLDVAALEDGAEFTQRDPRVRRRGGWDNWTKHPDVTAVDLTEPTQWRAIQGPERIDVSGRLIGGCLDVLCHLAGTPYGDVPAFAEAAGEGTIVYLENCEMNAFDAARSLHGLRLAGWFDRASAILLGRTSGPDSDGFTHDDAVMDALGRLDVPVIADVDFGHVPPGNILINGALAHVIVDGETRTISQRLSE